VDDLRDEIAHTRAELGETVEALAAKADVKARLQQTAADTKAKVRVKAADTTAKVRDKAAEVGDKLRANASDAASAGTVLAGRAQDKAVQVREDVRRNPVPYGVIAAGVAAVVAAVLIWRRRSR
jgi:cobalamin biosynthesis Mg chelatase CobN